MQLAGIKPITCTLFCRWNSHFISSGSWIDLEKQWFRILVAGSLRCNIYKCPHFSVLSSAACGLLSIYTSFFFFLLPRWRGERLRMERITKSTAGHLMKSLTWHVAFWLNSWIQCVIMAKQDLLKLSEEPVIRHIWMIKAVLRGRKQTRVPWSELLYNKWVKFALFCTAEDSAKKKQQVYVSKSLSDRKRNERKNQTVKRNWTIWIFSKM